MSQAHDANGTEVIAQMDIVGDLGLKASARDNVTVVVADIAGSSDPTSSTPQIVGAAAARATASGQDHPSSARATPLSRETNAPDTAHADEQEPPVLAEKGPQENFTEPVHILTPAQPGGSPKEIR